MNPPILFSRLWRQFLTSAASALAAACIAASTIAADHPNILWITAEDMSPTLGCYGDTYAATPNIDRLASESVRYTRAFASAPVCSPARSTLITGFYAPSLGTHQMRSAFPMPPRMRGFPAMLRDIGYFTSNNVKTDYNTSSEPRLIARSWNESSPQAHWRNRESDQPFFSVFNLMTSHQSRTMVWPREQFVDEVQSQLPPEKIHDPTKAPLPPYYPDTPVIRETIARYYDCVSAMDQEVGAILAQLEEDGVADDTIVFFYSDHGSGMPRHKRALLDSGMQVALLIRFPEKYQHLASAASGETTDQLVNFVDFPATVLSLAGRRAPLAMQGRPFLGEHAEAPRQYIFGHRDRIDEAFDTARSVRTKRYVYIRNYMPHLGYNQPSAWPGASAIRQEIDRLTDEKTMTEAQWQFAGPTRPVEELYDRESDPLNLRNLADSNEHREILNELRAQHRQHLINTKDLGFIPESELWNLIGDSTPWQTARSEDLNLETIYNAAAQVGFASETELLENLNHANASVRYWGVIGLIDLPALSDQASRVLKEHLEDDSSAVRIEAANALARRGAITDALPALIQALDHEELTVALHAARTIELLGNEGRAALPAMRQLLALVQKLSSPSDGAVFVQSKDQDLGMFISFSVESFIKTARQTRRPPIIPPP